MNHDEIVPFSMSSKDMSLVDELPKLIELGVDSFKIEGRMKSLHYIATVVSTYRKLIDTYCADPDHFNKEGYRKKLKKQRIVLYVQDSLKIFQTANINFIIKEMNIQHKISVRVY